MAIFNCCLVVVSKETYLTILIACEPLCFHFKLEVEFRHFWIVHVNFNIFDIGEVVDYGCALTHPRIRSILFVSKSENADLRLDMGFEVVCHHLCQPCLLMIVHLEHRMPILCSFSLAIAIKNMNEREQILVKATASESRAWIKILLTYS